VPYLRHLFKAICSRQLDINLGIFVRFLLSLHVHREATKADTFHYKMCVAIVVHISSMQGVLI